MKQSFLILILWFLGTSSTFATWQTPSDTITIELRNKTKVILITKDTTDLNDLLQYDFNQMVQDVVKTKKQANPDIQIIQIEDRNGVLYKIDESSKNTPPYDEPLPNHPKRQTESAEVREYPPIKNWKKTRVRSYSSPIFEFGMNNWLESGEFPNDTDKQYSVKNWGSWQVSVGYGADIVVGNPLRGTAFILRTGFDISWYNFKFVDPSTQIIKGDDGIEFQKDPSSSRNYDKSKLTASYFNFRLVPMFAVHDFKIGLGVYGGVLLGNHTKVKYNENGDSEKDKDYENLYLNSWRYGLRGEIGYGSFLFYANYDFNPLFHKGKAPELHGVSFGISLFFN